MKVALPIRRSLICNYQRLTYPLPTFNTHKRYAGTPLFVCNSCTVICFVRCNTRNPRLSASGQTQSKTRTTDFFCLTFSNQSLMWTFRFQLETANMGCIFHRGREDHMLTTSHGTILQTDEFLLYVFRLIYHHH